MSSPEDTKARLADAARRLGLTLFGVTSPDASTHGDRLRTWLADGYHGEMGYLARPDAIRRRVDVAATMKEVRSVIVVGHEYLPNGEACAEDSAEPAVSGGEARRGLPQGLVARYARGDDYHDVLRERLEALSDLLRESEPGARTVAYVDTGPLLERDLGRRAGLGWFGKNTMLINPQRGSWFFLGVLLTDVLLPPDPPFVEDRCGSCRSCLDACPTGALLGRDPQGAPVMDARLCISYLTIELKGSIPEEVRPALGMRVFGCDICQEVCPWNERFATPTSENAYVSRDELDPVDLVLFTRSLLGLSEKAYQRRFAGSPLARPRRRGMLRNACVALGNWLASGPSDPQPAISVLRAALEDPQEIVREHAAWALRAGGLDASRL